MQPFELVTREVDAVELYLQLRVCKDGSGAAQLVERLAAVRASVAEHPSVLTKSLLSREEQAVVWLLISFALRPSLRELAALRDEWPTLDEMRMLVFGMVPTSTCFDIFEPSSSLRRLELIQSTNGSTHDSCATWTIARRLMSFACGSSSIDAELAPFLLTREDHRVAAEICTDEVTRERLVDALRGEERRVVVVAGGTSALTRDAIEAASSLSILAIDMTRLPKDPVSVLRSIARECRLFGLAPLLDQLVTEQANAVGRELVAQLDGPILVTCGPDRPHIQWDRPVVVVEMPPPTTAQRAELWKRGPEVSDGDADLLAERYPLAPGLIVRASEAAKARANGEKLGQDDVFAGIRAVLDDKLGAYAKRVTVTQTWDDLVLPQDQLDPIVELMARVRGRRRVYEQWGFAAKVGKGLGVSALFSGPPGTGKTMVAALIAKELGLELYQVDMAKLVSKYIGETEKHLAAMFDAAEAGHAILLFDECDSLFGRRTEVRSSNDRYANLETNYLLQRLESFTGICLLTTNHESNLDPAFHRRLSLHVRFDLPDERERAKLWRAVLPAAAPVAEDVDFAGLARRYEMSGGYIKNAALRAAFLAADEDTAIGAAHLERAARVEYEAMGKLAA